MGTPVGRIPRCREQEDDDTRTREDRMFWLLIPLPIIQGPNLWTTGQSSGMRQRELHARASDPRTDRVLLLG